MKMIKVLALVAGLVMATGSAAEARQAMGVHEKIVDGFMYLVDNSGSMMMDHKSTGVQKIEMAKRIISKIDSNVPALDYQAALNLFSPNASVVAPTTFDEGMFDNAVQAMGNNAKIYGRLTTFQKSFNEMASMIGNMSGSKAVFLISDGMENIGVNPAQAAQALYAANPNMVLHVISVADSAKGMANLKAVAALNENSLYVDGRNLIYSDDAAKKVVSTALYETTIPSQMVTSMHAVLFRTAKYDIMPKYAKLLDGMIEVMVTRPELKIYVEGFADITGGADYNLTLSQNRVKAVADYLVNGGVKPEQIIGKGLGELDYYPTHQLDRRVDIMIVWE